MKVQSYRPARRRPPRWLLPTCGCMTLLGVGLGTAVLIGVFLLPLIPQLALQGAGFEPLGNTDAVFSATSAPAPTLASVQGVPPSIVVQAGEYGQQTIDTSQVDVQIGDSSGMTTMQVAFSESDMRSICQQYSPLCTPSGSPVRNATFDFRSGGMVVNGEFYVEQVGIWQQVGVVLRASGNQFVFEGVDVNGQLFAVPPDDLGELVAEVESTANDLLRQLSVQAAGETFTLRELYLDDATLTMVLR